MTEGKPFPKGPHIERVALVLQGGGALGAYQVGVYQALAEHGFAPDWVAGTSIGAINAAIIAGNTFEHRMPRLEDFWRTMSSADFWNVSGTPNELRRLYNLWSVSMTFWFGQSAMFRPRMPNLFAAQPNNAAEQASFYDTAPLRETLEQVVDFECINRRFCRLSLGAVHVNTGKPRYFDNAYQTIRPEHVMASGALPPGFPPVRVEGELYWDGAVFSNTPIEVVLDDLPRVNTLCFVVDLFNAYGPEPKSIPDVLKRHKDITYATRSARSIMEYQEKHNLRRAIRALYKALPANQQHDPELKKLAELGCHTTMEIVHISYGGKPWEMATRDANFSWAATEERWEQGYRDASQAIKRAAWMEPVPAHVGVVVYEQNPSTEPSMQIN